VLNTSPEELKSFGVFLGSFANPPTRTQTHLLSQWDVLVVDPLQDGVFDALSTSRSTSPHIVGRLDVRSLVKSEGSPNSDEVIRSIQTVAQTLGTSFKSHQEAGRSPFTGVLLADYQTHFQPAVLNEIAKFINGLGLDLWLEMSPPDYLTERQCRDIRMDQIRGIVCRNGTIRRSDGDRQNYFQMTEMRAAMRTIAAQRVAHGPPLMMWEMIDDGVPLQYAVVQRSFNWCRFNSALLWIGSAAALTDADVATAQTVAEKPLGALMWLKDEENMKAHDVWRSNDQISQTSCGHDDLYNSLQSFVPDLAARLQLLRPPARSAGEEEHHAARSLTVGHSQTNMVSWHSQTTLGGDRDGEYAPSNPLSTVLSEDEDDLNGFGCYQLGLGVTPKAFADLLQGQRNLRELELLQRISVEELHQISGQISALLNTQTPSDITFPAINELVRLLNTTSNDDDFCHLQVYLGLHSGFQTNSDTQFWGLYDVDPRSGIVSLYLSGKSTDLAGTILHTFLSARGFTRIECFKTELSMSEQNDCLSERWQLPLRIVYDVEHLSPTETILFLRRLVLSRRDDNSVFWERVRAYCEYQLLEVPTTTQLRALNSIAYLRSEISAEDLIISRLTWLRERGSWHPDLSAAISLFAEVDARLYDILMNGQTEILSQLSVVIQSVMQKNQIDAGADIFALSVFCAFRKLALDEIYLEVMDRNPLPNHATDQAGCFAENFALGSRCDSFFDMTPRSLGRIISDRYRAYYMKHQPPSREEGFTELPTAYAAMQIDLDPQDGEENIPSYYQVTFLGIFALPALCDIMLLTTVGRGLYLTTFMSSIQKTMATTALMLALLVCGAVGSWISSGGSYYFYANAFPAMNMFVLTRFVAGIAFASVAGLGAMVGIIVVKGIEAGLVFFFYFAMLTTYLLALSTLSIYQLPGSRFQSVSTFQCISLWVMLFSRIQEKVTLLNRSPNFRAEPSL
jgi:hypothetical protein